MSTIVAALLMLKNEENHVLKTLKSLPRDVQIIVINDTGSTDATEKIVKKFCKEKSKECVYIHSIWKDFSTNRNLSWAAVPSRATHIILLDASDEIVDCADSWLDELEKPIDRWFVTQRWWTGTEMIEYKNFRLVRNIPGHNYQGVVHEALYSTPNIPETDFGGFVLYQDRTQDGGKSGKRFERDLVLLQRDFDKNPKNCRTVFYLAQTLHSLGRNDEAVQRYRERLELGGFEEERFVSAMWLAENLHDAYYARQALSIDYRSEPLILLCKLHIEKKEFNNAYACIKEACRLELPTCRLWFRKNDYDYSRWHQMGITAWYVKSTCLTREDVLKDGQEGCEKAIMYLTKQPESDRTNELLNVNMKNLLFYTEQ